MSMQSAPPAGPFRALRSGPLSGHVRVPGDRSVGRRALMLGALAIGETVIGGLADTSDIRATAAALRAFGATIAGGEGGAWRIRGVGVGGFLEPEDVVDLGDAGRAAGLLLGLVASQAVAATFTGDAALREMPMGRLLEPLRRMGAQCVARSRDRLPLTLRGADVPLPIECRLPAGSAPVKSAVLFAALNAPGVTTVVEPVASRDHSERMLAAFGAAVETETDQEGARIVRIEGRRDLRPQTLEIPGDPGAAAFPIVAALVVEGSDVRIEGVLVNPLRIGLMETLIEMGGDIAIENRRIAGGEPVADIRVRASRLKAVSVSAARMAAMADDLPALAVAAAFAERRTVIEGLGALRQAHPERIAVLAALLAANGVAIEEGPESLAVTGSAEPAGGGRIASVPDPSIALALVVFGLGAAAGVAVDDAAAAGLADLLPALAALGARIEPLEAS